MFCNTVILKQHGFLNFAKKKRMNKSNRRKMTSSFLVEHSGKVGVPGSVLLIAILWVFYESAESVLVKTPTNTTVIANQSTFFNCSKSGNKSDELTWHHYPVRGQAEGVYETGSIRGIYKGRFDIDKHITSGSFNLLVQRPEASDAGRYACLEDPLEKDPGASAELTVLDSNFFCEANMDLHEVIGSTQCDKIIPSDEPLLSCSATYSGNIAPQMEWINDEMASESLKTECNTTGNRVMCSATLNANFIKDGSVFVCQLATAKQYNCSLKVNKTIYTFSDNFVRNITLMDEAFCFANTSAELSCSYKWRMDNRTVQLGQKLKTNQSGLYRCEAECMIRNETCAFTAKQINILESAITSSWTREWLWLLVIAFTAIAVLVYCVWKKQNSRAYRAKKKEVGNEVEMAELRNTATSSGGGTKPNSMQNDHEQSSSASRLVLCCVVCKDEDKVYDTEENFVKAVFIENGLNGEMHGPGKYQGNRCTFAKITFPMTEKAKAEQIQNKALEWKTNKHNNLISIYEVQLICKEDLKSASVFIIMDYAAGGSVRDSLKICEECKVNLPMTLVKDWAMQIANGMEYLHEKDIIHKNLNSAQIRIKESFKATNIINKTLKITQCCLIDDNITGTHAQEKFSFTAPEAFDGIYDKHSDVWSFGIVMWEILTKEIPYNEEKAQEQITADIRRGAKRLEIPDSCPKALKTILDDCRLIDRCKRPAFSKIVESLQKWQLVNSPVRERS